MLIFGEELKPVIIGSVMDPLVTPVYWTLNLEQEDFMFANIGFLEEHSWEGKGIQFDGQYVEIPAAWYILIGDADEGSVDCIQIDDLMGQPFEAMLFEFNKSIPKTAVMEVVNAKIYTAFSFPIIPKHIMMVHPINEDSGIIISPIDQTKQIRNKTMMDFLMPDYSPNF